MESEKVWREKKDPMPMIQSIPTHLKPGGWGVMAWACMATTETGSLVFIDDVTADRSRTMNSMKSALKYFYINGTDKTKCLQTYWTAHAKRFYNF